MQSLLASGGVTRRHSPAVDFSADAQAVAPRKQLIALVRWIMAAHRARQKAAVERALRCGLAAID
jgi:hypothetical protein